jgi:hypothetical protein
LTWEYEESCDPDNFRVELFSPDGSYPLRSYTAILPGSARSWTVGSLEPGMMYSWRVTVMDCGVPGPASYLAVFYTGPYCTEADRASYAEPVLLRPFDGEIIRSTIDITGGEEGAGFTAPATTLLWDDPNSCLPPESYSIQISRDRTFHRRDLNAGSMTLFGSGTSALWFAWPEFGVRNCDRIYWRVLIGADRGYDIPSPEERYAAAYAISDTWSFVINTGGMLCSILDHGPWITPIPLEHWFPEIDLGAPAMPLAAVIEDAACWSGPSMEYVILDYLTPGQELDLEGRNQDSTWWYVDDPAIDKACWVYGEHVEVSGDLSQVPVQQAPPLPTRTPTNPPPLNCGQYTDPTSCANNQSCWWDPNDPPQSQGSCKNK